jgi:hypothetical protein
MDYCHDAGGSNFIDCNLCAGLFYQFIETRRGAYDSFLVGCHRNRDIYICPKFFFDSGIGIRELFLLNGSGKPYQLVAIFDLVGSRIGGLFSLWTKA